MTDRHPDDDYLSGPAGTSLPTPQDTPYRTPSRTSKMSKRSGTPSARGESPASLPGDRKDRNSKRLSKDITTDETISILDPRRFTPTLHANLVSEILALRRDQDEKLRVIESLESTLTSTKEEQQSYQEKFTTSSKENRSLKRQLALLEGGTSSALGELARERDEAVETMSDVKKRLETAQKKIRTQETDSERVHELWAQEKDAWEDERRKFERKVHVAESRLKTVLEEVAAFQNAQLNGEASEAANESDAESGKENDSFSVRSMSMSNSIRFSTGIKLNGNSLADELHFDGDETDDQTDYDGRESALSHRTTHYHTRNMSRDSFRSKMHYRNQSLENLKRSGSVARSRLYVNQSVLETLEGEMEEEPKPTVVYTDTGVQYSPPPSPKMSPVKPATPEPVLQKLKAADLESSPRGDSEVEANQRKKRVQITPPLVVETPPVRSVMVSSASQTVEEPLSPPRTPTIRPETPPPVKEQVAILMVTSSTQTERLPPSPREYVPPPPLTPPPPVPSISIQPPTSRPTTPREPRLPPHFKNFGCQVNLNAQYMSSEASVQTEGIQVDKRIALLPHHLQPSSISSRPTSPNPSTPVDPDSVFTPVPGNVPPRNPRRLADRPGAQIPSSPLASPIEKDEIGDAYPGNNDDGPLSSQKQAPVKRPHRFSSLFAGFDTASSDEGELFDKDDLSDSEYRTALSAPRPQSTSTTRNSQLSPPGTAPPSPDLLSRRQSGRSSVKPFGTEVYSSFSLAEKDGYSGKTGKNPVRRHERSAGSISRGPGNRASVMRKAAMIQSGIASHSGRARSPSIPEVTNPPFPIPKRESSRKPYPSMSAPTSDGQRSPTRVGSFQRRGTGRGVVRNNSLRKVRSATAIVRNQRARRTGSRSPPPLSPSTEAPESPGLPPLPRNDITTPRLRQRGNSHYRRHAHKPSTNTEKTSNTEPASIESTNQSTSVVDAIAQTMIGEWMLKYVRRRKSFTVAEHTVKDDAGNDRHKRWVWLAPYERAILWSSKQPSSGSALMGKTGRKLTIQSVLDVKDDNPPPKGVATVFNRSILILTPQRALKFTATTPDRHYVWLTALSFLAHSSQAIPDMISAPGPLVKPTQLPDAEFPPQPKIKRGGIRDSIRLAKGRTAPSMRTAVPSVPSIQSAQSSQLGDVAEFHIPETLGVISSSHVRENSEDAAEPPFIPRFNERSQAMAHGRKRSNTGGHIPPPLSFRGFSGPVSSASSHNPTNSTAAASIGTAGSSDIYQSQGSSSAAWGLAPTLSQRTSEASSQRANFFDAVGTVRMEAFISPLTNSQYDEYPDARSESSYIGRRLSKEARRRRSRSRNRYRDSYGQYSATSRRTSDDRYGSSRIGGDDESYRDDPFRGF